MTIEEQQEAIGEGLAELMKPHVNYPEEMADTILAFLHEKGAVLKFDPRVRREGQMDEVPRLTMTAPLTEKR